MSKGVFNPYVEEKEEEKPVYIDPIIAESGLPQTKVRLDGDSYVIELTGTELDKVPERLAQIVQDVEQPHLERHRVSLTQHRPESNAETMVLPTPMGFLEVYVGEGGTEIDVFRRLGNAFYGLNDVLTKHNTRVIVRA